MSDRYHLYSKYNHGYTLLDGLFKVQLRVISQAVKLSIPCLYSDNIVAAYSYGIVAMQKFMVNNSLGLRA